MRHVPVNKAMPAYPSSAHPRSPHARSAAVLFIAAPLFLSAGTACAPVPEKRREAVPAIGAPTSSAAAIPAPRAAGDFPSPTRIGVTPRFDRQRDPDLGSDLDSHGWTAGSELVYGIILSAPGRLHRWLLRLQVLVTPDSMSADAGSFTTTLRTTLGTAAGEHAFESSAAALEISTFDDMGNEQHSGGYVVPADFFRHGIFPGAALGCERSAEQIPQSAHELQTMMQSLTAWLGLFQFAAENPALKPIMDTAIARPSLLRLLLNGMKLELAANPHFFQSQRAATFPGLSRDVMALPFEVLVCDAPALVGTMFVAPSDPPLLPAAGIVGIEAWHPKKQSRTVSIRLLSATCGAPQTAGVP
jgi:hypothetical protein